jgi:hypothetical protein
MTGEIDIASLATARKNARTDADAAAIAWAEETITYMRKLPEQQALKMQRAANERLRKALEESTLFVKRLVTAYRANTGQDEGAE